MCHRPKITAETLVGRLQAHEARRHPKQLCNDNNWIWPAGMSQEAVSLPNPDRCLIVQLSTHCAHNFILKDISIRLNYPLSGKSC